MAGQRTTILLLAAVGTWCSVAYSAEQNLTDFDLATLMSMDVTVTSAAKRAQATEDAAAAVFVLTREDIRRSGATSIPDLLRTVPGVQVARINTRSWAVTARGFNSKFANKLQVLVDGRSIYATIFSGVMWEEQFVPLEQIERIEVIRGPGGALWGINAMNGVINIITKRPEEDPGLQVGGGGGEKLADVWIDYGADLGFVDARFYAEHSEADAFRGDRNDLDLDQVGLRLARSIEGDRWDMRAEYADADFGNATSLEGPSLPPSARVGNVAFGWRRAHVAGAETQASTYHSWTDRGQPGGWDETVTGFDAQHTAARRGRHLLTYGAGYRYVTDDQRDARAALAFTKASLEYSQWSVYVQDESFWLDEQVRFIAGAKLEDFKYTGLALQPTLRALWHVDVRHTLWGAASRAVRTPSRFELHSEVETALPLPGPPTYLSIRGSEHIDAEQLDAFELGWRWRPDPRISVDLALFRHEYENLIMYEQLAPVFELEPTPRLVLPLQYTNSAEAQAYGAEATLEWLAAERLRLQGAAHWLDLELPTVANSLNAFGAEPQYAWSLRAKLDIAPAVELDFAVRSVDALMAGGVPGYESVDLRFGWRPSTVFEFSLSVDNVLDKEHVEFFDEVSRLVGASLGRTVFARAQWRMRR